MDLSINLKRLKKIKIDTQIHTKKLIFFLYFKISLMFNFLYKYYECLFIFNLSIFFLNMYILFVFLD